MTKGSNFWVIGGEFGSMNFHKLVEGSAQVKGPFKTALARVGLTASLLPSPSPRASRGEGLSRQVRRRG